MRFWRALLNAFVHAIATVSATMLVHTVMAGWMIFVMGGHDGKFGPWGTFRFFMVIALIAALMQSSVPLVASLVAHFKRGRIPGSRLALSSLTLVFFSPSIWFAADAGGTPPLLTLFGLPVASACWLIGPKQKRERQEDIEQVDGEGRS